MITAERPAELLVTLVEEIVSLGFSRALVFEVDFRAWQMKLLASYKCDKRFLARFAGTLKEGTPLRDAIEKARYGRIRDGIKQDLYAFPMILSSAANCAELENEDHNQCLARLNDQTAAGSQRLVKTCQTCGIENYVNVVVVEAAKKHRDGKLRQVTGLVELCNAQLMRLLKISSYCRRIQKSESTSAQGRNRGSRRP